MHDFWKLEEDKVINLLHQFSKGEVERKQIDKYYGNLIENLKKNLIEDIKTSEDKDHYINCILYWNMVERISKGVLQQNKIEQEIQMNKKIILLDEISNNFPKNLALKDFNVISEYNGESKVVYFDQNILTYYINDFKYVNVPEDMKVAYSPAHIEEIYKSGEDFVENSLRRISEITNNLMTLFINEILSLAYEEPIYSYNRVKKNIKATELAEQYKLLTDNDCNIFLKKYTTEKYRKIINSKNVENFFVEFKDNVNEVLLSLNSLYGIDDIIASNEIIGYDELNEKIHTLYKVMDLMGFKKDNEKRKVKSSRHDIEHLLYATKANYFITNDKKLRYRAINIYKLLKKKTKVLSLEEFNHIFN